MRPIFSTRLIFQIARQMAAVEWWSGPRTISDLPTRSTFDDFPVVRPQLCLAAIKATWLPTGDNYVLSMISYGSLFPFALPNLAGAASPDRTDHHSFWKMENCAA